ncbi:ABC-2 type transport system permease protein [Stackebrandtia endophytica]|uniref:ABC-2 type transport system permease protein n=1 Tax=Stackebrandtia endophytica TaxID=1496996 RepID=A0A543AVP2_9ACTN|nr:ABC transporter permease [Stackebrandtia endophytica]TQL76659.1 ABC-2 type transport system permease protein [Stackebrandtia endophytica]
MTTTTVPTVTRPGVRAWLALMVSEMKMVSRDTAGLVIPIGLPMLILIMNGQAAGTELLPGGLTVFDVYVLPLVLVMVVGTIGVINMPSFLSYYRRTGVLKRLGVTPANPAMVLVAQVAVSFLQTLIGLALAIGVSMVVFGASLPLSPLMAVACFGLSCLAMYSVGMLVAAVSPTPNSSVAIGLILFFLMGALGGMFGGTDMLPDAVARVGEALPFGAAIQAVSAAWAGETPQLNHIIALGTTTVVSGLVSARFFRWE